MSGSVADLLDSVAARQLTVDPAAGATQIRGEFKELQPLDGPQTPLPMFPTHCLPAWMMEQVEDVSAALQTPPALAALFGLGVLSTAAAERAVVHVSGRWFEPIHLYTCAILPPGAGKSPVFREMMEPVKRVEIRMDEGTRAERAGIAEDRKFLEAQLAVKRSAAAQKSGLDQDNARDEARRIAVELDALPAAADPMLRIDDFTPEMVAITMAANNGRIAVLSDEGGVFSTIAGRYGSGTQSLDIWLKPYSGTEIRISRVGRPGILLRRTALTISIAVQPGVFTSVMGGKSGDADASGLLSRFMWAVPESNIGYRDHLNAPPMTASVSARYTEAMLRVFDMPARTDDDGDTRHPLRMSAEGAAMLLAMKQTCEPQMRPGGELDDLISYVQKLDGRAARIAGLLHLAEHADHPAPWTLEISPEITARAIEIIYWSLPHARAAFALTCANVDDPFLHERRVLRAMADADDTIKHAAIDKLARKGQGRTWTASDTGTVIRNLIAFGYLARANQTTKGRPRKIYDINPAWVRPQ